MEKRLVPFCVHLYSDHIEKLKEKAGSRKVAGVIRDAISMILDGEEEYTAGYNRALQDAVKLIAGCKEIEVIAINGKYLSDVLADQLEVLKK